MMVRMTVARTTLAARLTALGWSGMILLVPVAVSACSGASSTPTVPAFSPSVTISPTTTSTVTVSPSGGVPSTVPAIQTVTPQVTVTVTITPTATVIAPPTVIPTAAPITGGGGTAGLQHIMLFGLGAAAILVGAGSLAYRRWLTRGR